MENEIKQKLANNEDLNKEEISFLLKNAKREDDFLTILSTFVLVEE